jgi:hypothetical protein
VQHSNRADSSNAQNEKDTSIRAPPQAPSAEDAKPSKTIAQLDKELAEKLAGRTGDGGSAAVEYEDGKPVAMKRSVKNNMFRYI